MPGSSVSPVVVAPRASLGCGRYANVTERESYRISQNASSHGLVELHFHYDIKPLSLIRNITLRIPSQTP